MKKAIIAIILMFIIIVLFVCLLPNLNQTYVKQGELYINKILCKNVSIKKDNNGIYSDYIEIYNGYSFNVNLKGYHLSDSEFVTDKWTFPDIIVKSKESLIVYASGNDTCDLINQVCHTNFKLSSSGEVITLSDKHGNIISKFTYPEQYPDTFYGYINGKYTYISKDEKEVNKKNNSKKDYKIEITEYMTHNKRSYYDEYGNYYDWIEIHNNGNDDYTLEGLYLTDDMTNLKKYELPNVKLEKDKYLIIYLAGQKKEYDRGIYADFKLSDDDKYIIISNGNVVIEKVPIVKLVDNVSYGKTSDGWAYFTTATPGMANTTASFKTWGNDNGSS